MSLERIVASTRRSCARRQDIEVVESALDSLNLLLHSCIGLTTSNTPKHRTWSGSTHEPPHGLACSDTPLEMSRHTHQVSTMFLQRLTILTAIGLVLTVAAPARSQRLAPSGVTRH